MSLALQRKVQKVLDARVRFDQPEVAQAIQGLSHLHASSDARALPSRVSGGAPASLTLQRNFRSLLDARTVSLHRQLLASFEPVRLELAQLDECLAHTASVASELHTALRDIKARSNTLFLSAEALSQQKAELSERQHIVDTFLARFQLEPADAALLASTNEDDIGPEFFAAIQKVETIKTNIQAMLVGTAGGGVGGATAANGNSVGSVVATGGSSRISLDLLDSLSSKLESSYELLYRSVSRQLQSGALVKVSDLTPKFVRCLQLLRHVPAYFDHCLADVVSSRRALLLERFLKALSRGSAGTRPIELAAHDAVRYCSDMLAWVHQALANEKEFLQAMFPTEQEATQAQQKQQQQQQQSPPTRTPPAADAPAPSYQQYLSSIFEALSRPLRVRIEQSFATASGGSSHVSGSASAVGSSTSVSVTGSQAETVFKIWNILKFYNVIMQNVLSAAVPRPDIPAEAWAGERDSALGDATPVQPPPVTDLLSTLTLLADHARSTFFQLLAQAAHRLCSAPPPPSADLSAGPEVSQWVSQLGHILAIYNSALVAPAEKEAECAEIMETALGPLLRCIRVEHSPSTSSSTATATLSPSLSPISAASDADALIYGINVLHAVLDVCAPFASFVQPRIDALRRLVKQQAERLVTAQAQAVLLQAGLARPVAAVAAWYAGPRSVPLSRSDGMDMVTLSAGVQALYGSLLSAGAFLVPQCDRLQQSALRRQCRVDIARALSQHYAQLYHAVLDPQSGFDPHVMQGIFLHAPSHVDLLLDVQGAASNTPIAMQRQAPMASSTRSTASVAPPTLSTPR